MGTPIDITGQKFHNLTAVRQTSLRSRRDCLWSFRCDCGGYKLAVPYNLRSGSIKCCGRNCPLKATNMIDLTGERFGKLTVLEEKGRQWGNHVMWECKCSCGNVTKVNTNNLRSGTTKSCGCLCRREDVTHGAIYAICDDQGSIKYIGQTNRQLQWRLARHIYDAKKRLESCNSLSRMQQWLISLDYTPEIKLIDDNIPIDELTTEEKEWIRVASKSYDLLNTTYNARQSEKFTDQVPTSNSVRIAA